MASSSSSYRQQKLAVSLYRHMMKWCREAPPNRSLAHLNHKLAGEPILSIGSLREGIRRAFRHPDPSGTKEGLQDAIEGLRLMGTISPQNLPILETKETTVTTRTTTTTGTLLGDELSSEEDHSSPETFYWSDWVNRVQWLPPLSDEPSSSSLSENAGRAETTVLPLFPLSGPLIPTELEGDVEPSDNSTRRKRRLPLFSQFSEIPVAGMEIPLKIFEPRYRRLYQDVLSDGTKRFVVPIAHPHLQGVFARYGWLYEIVRVEDVADQTNGQIHLLSHHLVTRAVRMDKILNPSDWKTQATYLRIEGEVMEDTFAAAESNHIEELEKTLRDIQSFAASEDHRTLAGRLLMGLAEGGSLWSMISIWTSWLQMEVLQIQLRIATKIEIQAKQAGAELVQNDMIELAQAPHLEELESMLMELSTLVPMLLQENPEEQCRRFLRQLKRRLLTASENS